MRLHILTGLAYIFATAAAAGDWKDGEAGYTVDQEQCLLDKHNEFRSYEYANAMTKLVYDDNIAANAQMAADRCVYAHTANDQRMHEVYNLLGENIYVTSVDPATGFATSSPVNKWWEEIDFYDYATDTCQEGKVCGHYQTVVWDSTQAMGCGIKYCNAIQGWNDRNGQPHSGYIVFCQYGPSGLLNRGENGKRPFYEGESCSNCPSVTPVCEDYLGFGMCAQGEVTTSTTTTTTTTTAAPTTSTTTAAPTTTVAPLTCSEGWTEVEGKCYKYMSTSKKYSKANAACANLDAVLAMPKTTAIYEGLREIQTFKLIWIGMNDLDGDGVNQWSDGTDLATNNWDNGHPNGNSCVAMFRDGTWRTLGCNGKKKFFCEKEMA